MQEYSDDFYMLNADSGNWDWIDNVPYSVLKRIKELPPQDRRHHFIITNLDTQIDIATAESWLAAHEKMALMNRIVSGLDALSVSALEKLLELYDELLRERLA